MTRTPWILSIISYDITKCSRYTCWLSNLHGKKERHRGIIIRRWNIEHTCISNHQPENNELPQKQKLRLEASSNRNSLGSWHLPSSSHGIKTTGAATINESFNWSVAYRCTLGYNRITSAPRWLGPMAVKTWLNQNRLYVMSLKPFLAIHIMLYLWILVV